MEPIDFMVLPKEFDTVTEVQISFGSGFGSGDGFGDGFGDGSGDG
jgi:hypothetical protein